MLTLEQKKKIKITLIWTFIFIFIAIIGFVYQRNYGFENKTFVFLNFVKNSIENKIKFIDISSWEFDYKLNLESTNKDFINNYLFYNNPIQLKKEINSIKLILSINDKYSTIWNKIILSFSWSIQFDEEKIPLSFEILWDPLKDLENPTQVKFNEKINTSVLSKYLTIWDEENNKIFYDFLSWAIVGDYTNTQDLVNPIFFPIFQKNILSELYRNIVLTQLSEQDKKYLWLSNSWITLEWKELEKLNPILSKIDYVEKSYLNRIPFYKFETQDLKLENLDKDSKEKIRESYTGSEIMKNYLNDILEKSSLKFSFSINPEIYYIKEFGIKFDSNIISLEYEQKSNGFNQIKEDTFIK